MRSFNPRFPIGTLGESMSEGLVASHAGMPAFSFTNAEAADIAGYLADLQTSPGAPAVP